MVYQFEFIASTQERGESFNDKKRILEAQIDVWAKRFRIARELWYMWPKRMMLTKIGSLVPASSLEDVSSEDLENLQQVVRVLNGRGKTSVPLTEVSNSLMNVLSNYVFNSLRVYVLLPSGKDELRSRIKDYIRQDLS